MKPTLNTSVSLFRAYNDNEPHECITLLEWVMDTGYEKEISKIRACNDRNKKNRLKLGLPAMTPSGHFTESRCAKNLVQHSGFICVDIDSKDNKQITNWENVKSIIADIPNVAYCGLSVSGNGLYALIAIAYPERHIEQFLALEYYFLLAHGIKIDTACKDVSRLRFISYDADSYINEEPQPFTFCIKAPNSGSLQQSNRSDDTITIQKLLHSVTAKKTDITSIYKDWFKIACIIANAYGEKGREIYHSFSQYSVKYNKQKCNYQYDVCLKRKYPYTVGTLVHIFKEHLD